jgi:serine/threonine protein kinase
MGDVFLVRDTIINRQAALKTIRPDTDLDAKQVIEMRQRFYREAQTAGKLNHPNIVTVYDVGEDLGMSYIVMEFVEGQTLTQWMKKKRLSIPQIKHVIYHAGLGLAYAHENGVFHRDVKPDNIMLSTTGGVKVMDFGIARDVDSSLTKTGSVMGTPAYMSPEQCNGQKVDGRSDTFSLGVILYELLTGRKPFKGDTFPSLMFAITGRSRSGLDVDEGARGRMRSCTRRWPRTGRALRDGPRVRGGDQGRSGSLSRAASTLRTSTRRPPHALGWRGAGRVALRSAGVHSTDGRGTGR